MRVPGVKLLEKGRWHVVSGVSPHLPAKDPHSIVRTLCGQSIARADVALARIELEEIRTSCSGCYSKLPKAVPTEKLRVLRRKRRVAPTLLSSASKLDELAAARGWGDSDMFLLSLDFIEARGLMKEFDEFAHNTKR